MSGLLARMGIGFNSTTLKVKLKMSINRMTMQMTKLNNQLTVERKSVANLLREHKDESARIRVEGIIHQRNLINVMEILALMCELLSQRIGLINSSQECSVDLEESIASIIYCSRRLDSVPELNEVVAQFDKKYGSKWVMSHLNNESKRVNPRIVDKLSVNPPEFEIVLQVMTEIAEQYDVEWKPDLEQLNAEDHHVASNDDIYRLGGIAGLGNRAAQQQQPAQPLPPPSAQLQQPLQYNPHQNQQQQPQPPRTSSQPSFQPQPPQQPKYQAAEQFKQPDPTGLYPGQLTLIVHSVEQLSAPPGVSLAGLVVAIQNYESEKHWRSECVFDSPSPTATNDGRFEFFPPTRCTLAVNHPQDKLAVEIRSVAGDELLGSTVVSADTIRRSTQKFSFPLYREAHTGISGTSGNVILTSEFLPDHAGGDNSSTGGGGGVNRAMSPHSHSSIPGGIDVDQPPPMYEQQQPHPPPPDTDHLNVQPPAEVRAQQFLGQADSSESLEARLKRLSGS